MAEVLGAGARMHGMTADGQLEARILRTYARFARGLDYHRQFLDRYLPARGLIAEVGCAEARVGRFYQSPARRFVGYDIDGQVLKAASRLGAPELVEASAFALPIGDAALDGYVGLGIFELDGAGGEVGAAEAARVLKPGGVLYVTVPYRNRARRAGATAMWRGIELPSYSEAQIRDLLGRHGFRTVLTRPSSIAWGLGPLRRLARLFPDLLVREREDGLAYSLLGPLLRPYANSLLAVAVRS